MCNTGSQYFNEQTLSDREPILLNALSMFYTLLAGGGYRQLVFPPAGRVEGWPDVHTEDHQSLSETNLCTGSASTIIFFSNSLETRYELFLIHFFVSLMSLML